MAGRSDAAWRWPVPAGPHRRRRGRPARRRAGVAAGPRARDRPRVGRSPGPAQPGPRRAADPRQRRPPPRPAARRGLPRGCSRSKAAPPAVYGELRVPARAAPSSSMRTTTASPSIPPNGTARPGQPVLRDGALEAGGREVAASAPRAGPAGVAPLRALGLGRQGARSSACWPRSTRCRRAGSRPSVNLKLFFEGEEEAGSPHLGALLQKHTASAAGRRSGCCATGPCTRAGSMQVFFGARGRHRPRDHRSTARRAPLHSGHYGNWAPNPALDARPPSRRRCATTTGRILVAGFYDDVRPPTASRAAGAGARCRPWTRPCAASWPSARTEAGGARLAERILLPALNVRGLASGGVGEQAANAIPTEARAVHRLPARARPDAGGRARAGGGAPARAGLRRRARARPTREARARTAAPGPPRLGGRATRPRAPRWTCRPRARSCARGRGGERRARRPAAHAGRQRAHARCSRSSWQRPVVGLPIVNHDNNQHAANENLRLQNLWDGIEVYAAVMTRLGPLWDEKG